jgi:acyl-CoA reductase-like NAD-dependent aldehyde dehydrogenase
LIDPTVSLERIAEKVTSMFEIPVLRFGQTYESMEKQPVVHFETGETLAQLHQATGAMVKLDLKKAQKSRDALRAIPISKIIQICKSAAQMYLEDTLPCGNGTLNPEQFCRMQSATTGLPENMCAANMRKNAFVLGHMDEVLDALTRGLPYEILEKGYGKEPRGVTVSFQATTPVFGMVLPNNSPGVHTLWLPAIAMQIGLCIKPGSQEFWTPYRITEAFFKAGLPREAISVYPGGHDVGGAVMTDCQRAMIFGGQNTVDQHAGNPRISVHGPGFSKILLGDDIVDKWEDYLDLMFDSVFANSGRSCINASGIWASRHTNEIAEALAKRLGPITPFPPSDPRASLAAFTTPGAAEAMSAQIDEGCQSEGVTEVTEKYRSGPRLDKRERYDYLRPTVIHCTGPDVPLANTEYMFPFVSVVECPQNKMLSQIKQTLVCTALTEDAKFKQQLLDATNIDRLNIGNVRTVQLNWLQPHEGNIVDFLFRNRAFQDSPPPAH